MSYHYIPRPVDDELDLIKEYNPPPLRLREYHGRYPLEAPVSPLMFYDKHLDQKLLLKRVRFLPSLLTDLAENYNRVLRDARERGLVFPMHEAEDDFPTKRIRKNCDTLADVRVRNPGSVASAYKYTTGQYCAPIASFFVLHPYMPHWFSVARWTWIYDPKPTEPYYSDESGSLRLVSCIFGDDDRDTPQGLDEQALSSLTQETLDLGKALFKRFPDLGTWVITPFSPEADEIIKGIGALDSDATFPAENSLTINFQTRKSNNSFLPELYDAVVAHWKILATESSLIENAPRDANETQVQLENIDISSGEGVNGDDPSKLRPTRRNLPSKDGRVRAGSVKSQIRDESKRNNSSGDDGKFKIGSKKERGLGAPGHSGEISTFPQQSRGTKRKREEYDGPSTIRLVQHAWAQSVRKDTTIIVFHSGNFERVGIRDRRNQTLWISDLIDVPNAKNPTYGHLHLGLHIAALEDAIDRLKQHQESEKVEPGADIRLQKSRATDSTYARKRPTRVTPKQRDELANTEKRIFADVNHRHVVVMYLQYGIYNSTVPASLYRCSPSVVPGIRVPSPPKRKRKYKPTQYFTLILTSEIGRGATGVVHGAVLELQTLDGTVLTHKVVVKLSLTKDGKARMRNEYSIYCSLNKASVTGIPTILGLFEHEDEGVMALVINYAGVSLRGLQSDGWPGVSPAERIKLLKALESIHAAGYCHNDIRPHNLFVNGFGEVAIIDFDRAEEDRHGRRHFHEYALLVLCDVLDGKEVNRYR